MSKFPNIESVCYCFQWNKYLCFFNPQINSFMLTECHNPIKIDMITLMTLFIIQFNMLIYLHLLFCLYDDLLVVNQLQGVFMEKIEGNY